MKFFIGSSRVSRLINFQQVKSFILNHGSHVKWLSYVSLFIAIAVDTSEMRFLEEKHFRLHKIIQNRGLLTVCLSVLLMNKTSTNSLIFYFDKAKQKKCVFRLHEKIKYQNILFLLSRNNQLLLKGLKSVDLKLFKCITSD